MNIFLLKINFCFLFLISGKNLIAQEMSILPNEPFKAFSVESSFSVLPDNIKDTISLKNKSFLSYTLNLSLFTNINKKWQIGLQYNYIWTTFDEKSLENFFIIKTLGRYNINDGYRIKYYGETGLALGNYCNCLNNVRMPDELPFKRGNMLFGSLGFGGMLRVYKPLWLKLSLTAYLWLNKPKNIYYGGYNVPIIGLVLDVTSKAKK